MTDQVISAPAAEAAPAAAIPDSFSDPREAARFYASSRDKRESEPAAETDKPDSSAARAEPATAEPKLSDEDNTAPAEQDPGETTETDPEDDLPPIDPPRSWTKAEKERFAALPRETQEYLHTREHEREREFRQSQNELAEQRKAIDAQRKEAEQVKQQYESGLAAQRQSLHDVNNREFADIKSMSDVEKIANAAAYYAENGDLVKAQQLNAYLSRWQVHQQKMAVVEAEFQQTEARKEQERQTEWVNHVKSEDAKFHESLAAEDQAKLKGYLDAAPDFLKDKGFTQKELNELSSGQSRLSIYDHRMQSIILDGLKFRELKAAAKTAVTKAVPPVQRPGARPGTNANAERTQALATRLNESGSLKDAAALLMARRASQRR